MKRNQIIAFFAGFVIAALFVSITNNTVPLWTFLIGYVTGLVVDYLHD
jgi:hypothetical protein